MTPAGELTLYDLLITLGERVGQYDRGTGADNRTVPETDPQSRDRLIRAINNGRREVYSRMPDARCFQPRLSITTDPNGTAAQVVGADISKYRLPYAVQGLAGGQWTWSLPSSGGWGGNLTQTHPNDIARMHYTANTGSLTGFPRAMALLTEVLNNPQDPGRKTCTILWIYPKPDQAYTLEGQVRIMYEPMVTMTDMEPMGQQHAETILAFAERDWELGRRDAGDAALIEARCDRALAISIGLDNAMGPQTIGIGYDPLSERDAARYQIARGYYPDRGVQVDSVCGLPTGI